MRKKHWGVGRLHIAICDDDKDELALISSLLDTFRQERRAPLCYKTFQSAADLLATAKGGSYVLYLLDVMMPGISGMEAAREIRGFDTEAKLVFLTSSPEFAAESYSVRAHDYLLKPVRPERLYAILDGLLAEQQRPKEGLYLKTQKGIARVLFSNLAYVEINNKRLCFHLSDGSVREVTAPLAEFEGVLLARPEFARVHRSYIVNLWQVANLSPGEMVTLSGDHLPVSRLLYSKVRSAYVEQIFLDKAGE